MSLLNQTAPDFTLINSKQEEVRLSEHIGKKVVLAFYPAAFSGICDQEMCVFEERLAQLNTAQALVRLPQLNAFSNWSPIGAVLEGVGLVFGSMFELCSDALEWYLKRCPNTRKHYPNTPNHCPNASKHRLNTPKHCPTTASVPPAVWMALGGVRLDC